MIVTGLLFGVAPALGAGRARAIDALRDSARAGGGRTRRLRAAFVVVEVAASVVLLVLSGLLIRSVERIQRTDPGFNPAGILTLRTPLPRPKYDSVARRAAFYDRVLQEVRALPGVQTAGYVTGLPMVLRGGIWPAGLGDSLSVRDPVTTASLRYATPGYFRAMGIPMLAGRDLAESDQQSSLPYVAVVSESFASKAWPNADPIGKRFWFAWRERTVVGVVGHVRVRGLEQQQSEPQVYLAYQQVADGSIIAYFPNHLVVRTASSTSALLPSIRRIVKAADPDQPISHARTMTEIVDDETASRMTQLRLLAVLSAIGLLIAGVGIHGLLTYSVSNRSQELGVRRALGAQASGIVGLVLGEGMRLAAVGVVAGVLVAYFAARTMSALLVGVRPEDPLTIATAVVLCVVVSIVGCVRPAMRAGRVDPMTALRAE
jgi:putative ABC transport system permease protein